jgi:hypothetical protein
MKKGHGNSRRQAYGRRMKDLQNRRGDSLEVDLDGPSGWSRGSAWDDESQVRQPSLSIDSGTTSARPR